MPTSLHLRVRELLEAALLRRTTLRTGFMRQAPIDPAGLREALALLPHYAAIARPPHSEAVHRPTWLPGRTTLARALGPERDTPELRPPFSIAPYTVVETIGQGGMGVVYRAVDPVRRTEVAIKLLHDRMASAEARWRFKHEEELLRQLRHPGIVRVHHGGAAQIVHTVDGDKVRVERPYFVMEYVRGQSLIDYATTRALSSLQRLALFSDVCAALEYAHHRGVIHRDLKPENILVDAAGRPRVLDFGIARLQSFAPRQQRSGPTFTGTIAYASPEQLAGADAALTPMSDVYTLGLILHELLSDALPQRDHNKIVIDIRRVRLSDAPPPDSGADAEFRYALQSVIATALRGAADRRYADAGALRADLAVIQAAFGRARGWSGWLTQLAAPFRRPTPAEQSTHDRLLSVLLRRRVGVAMEAEHTGPTPG